jgi:hypothetical protein
MVEFFKTKKSETIVSIKKKGKKERKKEKKNTARQTQAP